MQIFEVAMTGTAIVELLYSQITAEYDHYHVSWKAGYTFHDFIKSLAEQPGFLKESHSESRNLEICFIVGSTFPLRQKLNVNYCW